MPQVDPIVASHNEPNCTLSNFEIALSRKGMRLCTKPLDGCCSKATVYLCVYYKLLIYIYK